jgi:hypothetical protein
MRFCVRKTQNETGTSNYLVLNIARILEVASKKSLRVRSSTQINTLYPSNLTVLFNRHIILANNIVMHQLKF